MLDNMKFANFFLISAFLFLTPIPLKADHHSLNVGVILPLSGALAEYGVAARNGIELGLKEHPEVAQKVTLFFEDSQYDNRLTVTALQSLHMTGKAELAYVWGANPNEAAVPVAEQKQIPTLATTTSRYLTKGKKWSTRFSSPSNVDAEELLSWLKSKQLSRICIVKTELTFINGIVDAMKDALEQSKTIEILDSYSISDLDFKSSLLKLSKKDCAALGVFLASGQITQFFKELRKTNYSGVTFGTDFFDSLTEVKNAQGTMEGAVFSSPKVSTTFRSRYTNTYHNDVQIGFAANGYDFVLLLKAILQNSPGDFPRGKLLVNSIRQISKFETEDGDVTYSDLPSPGFTFPRSLKVIAADAIKELD